MFRGKKKKRKIYLSIITLIVFCLTLVPFPKDALQVQADTVNQKETIATAVVVGDFMDENNLGEDWNPINSLAQMKLYKQDIYEETFKLKPGEYNYKIAMNGSWDESYGDNGENIAIKVTEESYVTFRLNYKEKKVYDSINNPEQFKNKAVVTGNFEGVIKGASNWNVDGDLVLNYIGGGNYLGTFKIAEEARASEHEIEYKIAYNSGWNNGEVADNVKMTIPAGTEEVTFMGNYLENFAVDSISIPTLKNTVSLIGTLRNNENINWAEGNTDYDMYRIDQYTYGYSLKLAAGTYSYKAVVNHSWDGGGIPSSDNKSISLEEDMEVLFIVSLKDEKIIDSVNNYDDILSALDFKEDETPVIPEEPEEVVESPIINEDGTVTFRAAYKGDTLNLVGSMNGWDNQGIAMTKNEEGIFEVTLSLAGGQYEYKYFPTSGSWDNGFLDAGNKNTSNGNSLLNMPGLEIILDDSIEAGSERELKANLYDENGSYTEANPQWELAEEVYGVSIEGSTLKVSKDADESKTIKVKATEGIYTWTKEVTIISSMYTYIINYFRPDGNYDSWQLWLWEPSKNGATYEFNKNDVAEEGFARAEYKFSSNALNFIVKKGNWEEKDPDIDRTIEVQEGNTVEVWLVSGDENVYYTRDMAETNAKLKAAMADSLDEILVTASAEITDEQLSSFKLMDVEANEEVETEVSRVNENSVMLKLKKKFFRMVASELDATKLYEVSSNDFAAVEVTMRKILNDEKYYYDGNDLGLTYGKNKSSFKVWAPTAKDVSLMLYDDAGKYDSDGYVNNNTKGNEVAMERNDNGVWNVEISEDLNGKYYLYKVSFANGDVNYAVDPYAKAVAANGQRTAIINLDSTDPEGWEKTAKPAFMDMTDAIIYEMHIRDFSISDDSGMSNKGEFQALAEEGTTLSGTDISTGVDHLVDLGVTHVQIQPSYDYGSVNELGSDTQYNWGYDPLTYNVPEGYYSSDAANPEARIKEFKEMVESLHKNGIRVVMDVVYNHTFSIGGAPFDDVVPGYYYRVNDSGKYTNGSGCGNEVASERPMVRKYIKDSVKYWAQEYKIDGYRFDLAGLIDTTTIIELTNELRAEIDPNIIIYGEPWQAGGSSLSASMQTLKGSQAGNGFGVFNDNFRNTIKGGSDDATTGYATGASGKEADIVKGVMGSIDDFTQNASESINYVTAHDNLNLWDKIVVAAGLNDAAGFLTLQDGKLSGDSADKYSSVDEAVANSNPYYMITEENPLNNELVRRSVLSTGIIMTSQGIPFFQAGDEFLRSKYGDHNSYKSPDAINKINWSNKEKFKEVYDYYKGLIELRKSHPAFRMNTRDAIESNLVICKSEDNVVVFELKDYANGDGWKNIVVAYNGNTSEEKITLPEKANWNVVADEYNAGIEVLNTLEDTNTAYVAPLSMMVLYDESIEGEEQIPTTIEVENEEIGINPGGYRFVQPVVRDQNNRVIDNADIEWIVSDDKVISADKITGKVNGLELGIATLTLKCGNAEIEVKVNVEELKAKSIEIYGDDKVYATKELQLGLKVKDQFGQEIYNYDVQWSSSNEAIATVNGFGVVKGKAKGNVEITAVIDGASAVKSITINKYTKKYIEFTYVREEEDYEGWNIWTWQTGVEDGQKDFQEVKDGKAVCKFEIAPDTSSVGFVLRKGTDWNEKDPYDSDRYISIDPSMTITKVTVTSGVGEFFQVPAIENASINQGKISFKYRDEDLYEKNAQDTIERVVVHVESPSGIVNDYDMAYDEKNQYFEYILDNIESGVYKYRFIVTKDGGETSTEEYEIEYKKLAIDVAADVSLKEVNYNQNTIVNVSLSGDDVSKENIRSIYMDLSSLGMASKVNMNLDLLFEGKIRQSIGVKDSVTAGEKEIKVIVIDKNGEEHCTSTNLTVTSVISSEDELDFGFDESRIYFVVTDRFFNGDSSNDDPNNIGYDKKNAMTYHGGDLKGLTEKVSYLKDLGINTIWITPIVENTDFNQMFASGGQQYSYHGYWAKDFESLDPHLGTLDDLKELIDTAHDNGIKIMVDVVLNHAGYGMKEVEENSAAPNYPTDDDRAAFTGMFREKSGSDFETEEVSGLPDFRTEDPAVRAQIIKWQSDWIERATTDKGNTIDYFRVDTVKHVDNATLKEFKTQMSIIDPEFKMIGEYYGADINNTVGKLDNGEMDALLDFSYKNKARDFVNGSIEETSKYLDERAALIDNTNLLGQFLSSHDENGFLATVNYDLNKQMIASALQITDKGIPVVYYGEELGESALTENDANRYDMPWDKLEDENYSVIYNHYKKLLNIRKDYSMVFAKGDRKTIAASDEEGYTVYSRNYNDQSVIVALNLKEEVNAVTVTTSYKKGDKLEDLYNGKEYTVESDGKVTIDIPETSEGGTAVLTFKSAADNTIITVIKEQVEKVIRIVKKIIEIIFGKHR